MPRPSQSLRTLRIACLLSTGLLGASIQAQAVAAEPSCSDLLKKAERLESVARDIDSTVADIKSAQSTSEWQADVATYAEYANMGKAAVDGVCGAAGKRPGALGAACVGWEAGTKVGNYAVAAQELLEGSPDRAALLACEKAAGTAKGRCTQISGLSKLSEGDAAGAADIGRGAGEYVTDLTEKYADDLEAQNIPGDKVRGVAKIGRTGLAAVGAVSATKEIYDSRQRIKTIEVDTTERQRISAGIVSNAQSQAKDLRMKAAQLRVAQCNPDMADAEVQAAQDAFDLSGMATQAVDLDLMSSAQDASAQYDQRASAIGQAHKQAMNAARDAASAAAIQSMQMQMMQQQTGASSSRSEGVATGIGRGNSSASESTSSEVPPQGCSNIPGRHC